MSISLLSFNFKNTPVELREKLAMPANEVPAFLMETKQANDFSELVLLSTCNRVEFFYTSKTDPAQLTEPLLDWLGKRFYLEPAQLKKAAISLNEEAALNHLYRVASSLESMVIGEPQILGQLKDAYQMAVNAETTGPVFSGLMPKVFRTAKRVRTDTGIARYAVSVSYVAAELAGRIFETLEDKTVMVIGAGEMAELALNHLQKKGIRKLLITNRTYENGVALAQKYQGQAVRYEELEAHLAASDIVISSTGAPGYIIGPEQAREAVRMRKGEPVFLIDIAVPRDIDPAVNDLSNVYCYDIDDLQQTADANRAERERETHAAQEIITEELENYRRWIGSNQVGPVIAALRTQFGETSRTEMEKTLARLSHLSEADHKQVQKLVHDVVNKLLHVPSTRLKELSEEPHGVIYAEAVATAFGLSGEASAETSAGRGSGGNGDKVVAMHRGGKKA